MKKEEYFKKFRKFTDEELIEEYNEGFSDREIARRLNASKTTVQYRRYRLGLISKRKKHMDMSRVLNKKQQKRSYHKVKERRKKQSKKRPDLRRDAVARFKKDNPEKVKKNDHKQWLRKKKNPKVIERRKKYMKKYYQKHKEGWNENRRKK